MDKRDPDRERALKILARSIYRELTASGYDDRALVGLVNELLGTITSEMALRVRRDRETQEA